METRQVTLEDGRVVTVSGPVRVIPNRRRPERILPKNQFRVSAVKVGDVPHNFTRRVSKRELSVVNS